MARVAYRSADVDLMARMMRAEAEGEGKQGMLYVGNVKEEITLLKPYRKEICFIKEQEIPKED